MCSAYQIASTGSGESVSGPGTIVVAFLGPLRTPRKSAKISRHGPLSPGQPWTPALSIISTVAFVTSFGIGLGPIPWLLPAEIFPIDKCAVASGFAASCNWMANFVVGQVFLPMSTMLGPYAFTPFVVVLVLAVLFSMQLVPETKGKSLEQIQKEFNGEKIPKASGNFNTML